MKLGTLEKFLGLPDDADAFDLLGLTPAPGAEQYTIARIDEVLRRRIQQVYMHADGRGPEADDVRRALRAAAASLKAGIAQAAAQVRQARAPVVAPPPLTEFDRHVLATLVANGGWNAMSRSRLVALAASRGATVQGLIKVIKGLSEFARRGGGRVGVAQITSGRARLVPISAPPPSPITQFGDRLIERLVPDLKRHAESGTLKLATFFGVLALLIAVFAVAKLWPDWATSDRRELATDSPQRAGVSDSELGTRNSELGTRSAEEDPVEPAVRPAPFTELPTFADAGIPRAAVEAANGVSEILEDLGEVARRLIVSSEPAEAVFRKWEHATSELAVAWPLLDAETSQRAERAMGEVLLASAGRPAVIDRIMRPFASAGDLLREPLDVWRGAWRAGMLTRISRNAAMPPALSERAARLLQGAVGGSAAGDFSAAADAWLRRLAAPMVDRTNDDPDDYLSWELWLAAQHWIGGGSRDDRRRAMADHAARFDDAVMQVVKLIVRSPGDLSRQTGRLNVLGRLLRSVSFTTSFTVREAFLELFDDPEVRVNNLWVLTSILAQDPQIAWFGGEFVVPYDAGRELRRRYQYDLERRWPHIEFDDRRWAGRDVRIDDYAHRLWLDKYDEAEGLSPSVADDAEHMLRLLDWARLNEAAALLIAQRPTQAERPLHTIPNRAPRASSPPPGAPSPTNPAGRRPPGLGPGMPGDIGPDGAWAARYEEARRNNDERLRLLEVLRGGGRDLEPRNAAALVREAYRAPGGSQEIRSLAQSLVSQQFARGPNIAAEMLDQFPEAPRSEVTSEFLQGYTQVILPPARSPDWAIEARRALLEHAIRLLAPGHGAIDVTATAVAESYVAQTISLRGQELSASAAAGAPRSPTVAARRLVEAWRDAALAALVVSPFPDDVPGLDRRHAMRLRLAEGAMQEFVASQVAVFEMLLYLTASERPRLRDELAALAQEAAAERRQARDVLHQAVTCERMIARLWRIRLGTSPPGYLRPHSGEGDAE